MIEQAKQAKTPIEYDFQCRTSTLKSFLRRHWKKKWGFSHFDGEISLGRRLINCGDAVKSTACG